MITKIRPILNYNFYRSNSDVISLYIIEIFGENIVIILTLVVFRGTIFTIYRLFIILNFYIIRIMLNISIKETR